MLLCSESSNFYRKLESKYNSSITRESENFDDYLINLQEIILSKIASIAFLSVLIFSITIKSFSTHESKQVESRSYKIGFENNDYYAFNQTDIISGFGFLFNQTEDANFYLLKISNSQNFKTFINDKIANLWTDVSSSSEIEENLKGFSNSYSILNIYKNEKNKNIEVEVDTRQLDKFLKSHYVEQHRDHINLEEFQNILSETQTDVYIDVVKKKKSVKFFNTGKPVYSKTDRYLITYRIVNNQRKTSKRIDKKQKSKKTSIFEVE